MPRASFHSTCSHACIAFLLVFLFADGASAAGLSAAGGRFLEDVYAAWAEGYEQATGVRVTYAPVGSATALKQLRNGAVTVAISAIPLESRELERSGLVQFPVGVGGVVPVANISGIASGELVLDGSTLGKIFAREITRWNHPSIKVLNPSISLPAQRIAPLYPTGNSGIDFLFSTYLTQASETFAAGRQRRGAKPAQLPGRSPAGIAAAVRGTKGAIGYMDFAQARRSQFAVVRLLNRDGHTVTAGTSSFRAAAANTDWRRLSHYYAVLTNQPGKDSWPITGVSFAVMHREVRNGPAAGEALRFFDWAYERGTQFASPSDYVPLSSSLIDVVQQTWRTSIGKAKHPFWLVK